MWLWKYTKAILVASWVVTEMTWTSHLGTNVRVGERFLLLSDPSSEAQSGYLLSGHWPTPKKARGDVAQELSRNGQASGLGRGGRGPLQNRYFKLVRQKPWQGLTKTEENVRLPETWITNGWNQSGMQPLLVFQAPTIETSDFVLLDST